MRAPPWSPGRAQLDCSQPCAWLPRLGKRQGCSWPGIHRRRCAVTAGNEGLRRDGSGDPRLGRRSGGNPRSGRGREAGASLSNGIHG
jgi:hypothetical protein